MATPVRYFQQESYYHVFNRGNRKQNIFVQLKDYLRFLKRIREYKEEFGITITCYCLMPNHFHFILKQEREIPISSFMLRLCTSYAKYFNIKYEQIGSLFQDRFKAKLVDADEYLLHLTRYIHRNPLKLLLSTPGVELESYRWSSYRSFTGKIKDELVDPAFILNYFSQTNPGGDYKSFVEFESEEKDKENVDDFLFRI